MDDITYSKNTQCPNCGGTTQLGHYICPRCIQSIYNHHSTSGETPVFSETFKPEENGVKYDGGKLRWNLICFKLLKPMLEVLMFGAKKYAPGNYQKVDNPEERYYEAATRHLFELQNVDGTLSINRVDSESGLPHLAHAQCCLYFLEYFRQRGLKNENSLL